MYLHRPIQLAVGWLRVTVPIIVLMFVSMISRLVVENNTIDQQRIFWQTHLNCEHAFALGDIDDGYMKGLSKFMSLQERNRNNYCGGLCKQKYEKFEPT